MSVSGLRVIRGRRAGVETENVGQSLSAYAVQRRRGRPQAPYRGAASGPRGEFRPPDPLY